MVFPFYREFFLLFLNYLNAPQETVFTSVL